MNFIVHETSQGCVDECCLLQPQLTGCKYEIVWFTPKQQFQWKHYSDVCPAPLHFYVLLLIEWKIFTLRRSLLTGLFTQIKKHILLTFHLWYLSIQIDFLLLVQVLRFLAPLKIDANGILIMVRKVIMNCQEKIFLFWIKHSAQQFLLDIFCTIFCSNKEFGSVNY